MGGPPETVVRDTFGYLVPAILLTGGGHRVSAQENPRPGSFGISASLQAGQAGLLVPINLHPSLALVPSLAVAHVSDAYTDWILGAALRAYTREGKLRPCFAGCIALAVLAPSRHANLEDILVGTGIGGEYFFDKHPSAGVEAQVNVAFTDDGSSRYGAAGLTIVQTASVASVTVYF